MASFTYSKEYLKRLRTIEDYIFEISGEDFSAVERFTGEHEEALEFIAVHPTTPPRHPQTGDQNWPFRSGRYRVFFVISSGPQGLVIHMTDIIDNTQINLGYYPGNSLPTFEIDD